MERLRTLSEDECYLRCYGRRAAEDSVKVLQRGRLGASYDLRAEESEAGERLRSMLELRVAPQSWDSRESLEAV